jgi:hypothetical protein
VWSQISAQSSEERALRFFFSFLQPFSSGLCQPLKCREILQWPGQQELTATTLPLSADVPSSSQEKVSFGEQESVIFVEEGLESLNRFLRGGLRTEETPGWTVTSANPSS